MNTQTNYTLNSSVIKNTFPNIFASGALYPIPVKEAAHQLNGVASKSLTKTERLPAYSHRVLRLILNKTGLYELFQKHVPDPRRTASTIYSVPSLLMCGMLTFLLRSSSRNAFHEQAELSSTFGDNIARLSGISHAHSMPCPRTLEDLFLKLDYHDLEPILPAIFRQLLLCKFFQLNPAFKANSERALNPKAPNQPFFIAIDGQVTHTYYTHHQHPTATCPYCLKRTRGKSIWYIHCDVVLSVIGQDGFQMPLFLHRVRARQDWQECSPKKLKQECEQSALPILLEKFRHEFPHLAITLLLDSLYANATTMELAKRYHCDYIIVRKAGSLRSLNDDIAGLQTLMQPQTQTTTSGRWDVEQTAYLFPNMVHKTHTYTLIDLNEKCSKSASSRLANIYEISSHWQWIVSQTVTPDTVFKVAKSGRLRWSQEDFFNTLNNRGFNAGHDFSRAPHSQTIWRLLMFIAFSLSTLMVLSRLGCLSRGSVAIINWFRNIWGELAHVPPDTLWARAPPKQLRFTHRKK